MRAPGRCGQGSREQIAGLHRAPRTGCRDCWTRVQVNICPKMCTCLAESALRLLSFKLDNEVVFTFLQVFSSCYQTNKQNSSSHTAKPGKCLCDSRDLG